MSVIVSNAGLQTTLQGGPRLGFRHKGVPAGGAADALSLALANRLVGNELTAPALEITLAGAAFTFERERHVAIAGGLAACRVDGETVRAHTTLQVSAGSTLGIAPLTHGCRLYLAIAGGLVGEAWLGSASTYLPAKLGGFEGRALKTGDRVEIAPATSGPALQTPSDLRQHIGHSWILRATRGPEFEQLNARSQASFFTQPFTVSQRASRMGAALDGGKLELDSDGRLPSAAVFPGTLQCPHGGQPFLLMTEAQTTGGYPRIAQVVRADRHMLGQMRPGDRVQFICVESEDAAIILREKTALLQNWLGDTFELR